MLTLMEALDAILAEMEVAYDDEPQLRVLAQPGENLITDWCGPGACGMAFVRLDTTGTSTAQFPDPDPGAGRLGPQAATFHVGIVRCVAVQDAKGKPPAPEVQTAEARRFIADAGKIRSALVCLLEHQRPHLNRHNTQVGKWVPQGPLGGCAGGYWPLSVRVR